MKKNKMTFGRSVKLRVGTTSIQPGWIVNNNDIEHADFICDASFNFGYAQPLFERVLRFDENSMRRLSEDKSYAEEKSAELKDFKDKHHTKLVKAHAQVPRSFQVTPIDVKAWLKVQQDAGLAFIEILDVTGRSTTQVERTIGTCAEELDKGKKPVLGINTENPSISDALLRLEMAERYGMDYVVFYGSKKPKIIHVAIAEALQGRNIFAQYAGIGRCTKVNGRMLELVHFAQALGFNASSLFVVKAKEKKGKTRRKAMPPPSYDPLQWESISLQERLKKYGDEWPTDVPHPIIDERTTREIYQLAPKLRKATLRTFEAASADYELRKTEARINKGEYSETIQEKPTLIAAVQALVSAPRQGELGQF